MSAKLTILRAGPLMTVQDMGRPGRIADGLSPGGAMDRLALLEGAALLGLAKPAQAIEMAGMGGRFRCDTPLRFALSGAPMRAQIDDMPLRWNASHKLEPGQTLTIASVSSGTYGYLTPGGGIAGTELLGSVAAHLSVGLGRPLAEGDILTLGEDPSPGRPPRGIVSEDRFGGGSLRIMPGPQTELFDDATRGRLAQTSFHRSPRANRTGLPLLQEGEGFAPADPVSPLSDFIIAGDLQMTGDGTPYLMLAECQTIGGYPRIGTVIAADLPRAAQAPPSARLRFTWITSDAADRLYLSEAQIMAALAGRAQPLVRDPADIPDLLSYQLIDGVTAGRELDPEP
ncbi:urea amidolyase [Sulfitobacter sp. LCG007]